MGGKTAQISEARLIAGAVSLVAAAVSTELAWLHARTVAALGEICGAGPSPHCLWCPTALVLLAAGLALLWPRPGRAVAARLRAIRPPRS